MESLAQIGAHSRLRRFGLHRRVAAHFIVQKGFHQRFILREENGLSAPEFPIRLARGYVRRRFAMRSARAACGLAQENSPRARRAHILRRPGLERIRARLLRSQRGGHKGAHGMTTTMLDRVPGRASPRPHRARAAPVLVAKLDHIDIHQTPVIQILETTRPMAVASFFNESGSWMPSRNEFLLANDFHLAAQVVNQVDEMSSFCRSKCRACPSICPPCLQSPAPWCRENPFG